MIFCAENVGLIMEHPSAEKTVEETVEEIVEVTVEVMSPEELSDWVALNLDSLPEDEKSVIMTLMMLITEFYEFMAINPEVIVKYEAYIEENEENEVAH